MPLSLLVTALAYGAPSILTGGLLPPNTLTHFCVITGWDVFEGTLNNYSMLLGQKAPTPGIVGGASANGSYLGKRLLGTAKIGFYDLNNLTRMEILGGDPDQPSWWRDVYNVRGYEVHHMGYQLPVGTPIWPVVQRYEAAGLGRPMQWAHWGPPGPGCYVYMDSQATLGVTTEILALGKDCDTLPAPP